MKLIINRNDIAERRQISKSVTEEKLSEYIYEAQINDLQGLLGPNFYADLLQNLDTVANQALLNEGTYTYNGDTYTNYGLKAVLAEFAFSRYVLTGGQTDTPFSLVEKIDPNSTPVDYAGRKARSKGAQQTALNLWDNVRVFLDRNASTYPLWVNALKTRRPRLRISKIV